MSLKKRYVDRVSNYLTAQAAWEPGEAITLASVLLKDDGVYVPYAKLSRFTDTATIKTQSIDGLNILSSGARRTFVQGDTSVPGLDLLDPNLNAAVRFDFTGKYQFALRTSRLRHRYIENLSDVVSALVIHPDWRHREYYLVRQVYTASDYFFAGSEADTGHAELFGPVSALTSFIGLGVRVGLQSSSVTTIAAEGRNGTIAYSLIKIERDGEIELIP